MASNDPADTHGHTHAIAQAQEPTLDLNAPPASDQDPARTYEDFVAFGSTMVLAQSAAEVQAQIDNEVAGS